MTRRPSWHSACIPKRRMAPPFGDESGQLMADDPLTETSSLSQAANFSTRLFVDEEILVVISIDTEEDDWTPSRTPTLENIRRIPSFHAGLRSYGVKPTYFVSHAVASAKWTAEILAQAVEDGGGELGAHLHPWNTPPIEERLGGRNTMLLNLPPDLQYRKVEYLTKQHQRVFKSPPSSFRAGRFGMGDDAMAALVSLGYRVDCSVTPFWNWSSYDGGPDFRKAPTAPYRVSPQHGILAPAEGGEIVELPLTVGYTRRPFGFWNTVHDHLTAPHLKALRLAGLAARTGVYRKVVGSLEQTGFKDLMSLSQQMIESGTRYLHLFLHSSSLLPGLSPFTPRVEDVRRVERTIAEYAEQIQRRWPVRFVTASEAAEAASLKVGHSSPHPMAL